MALFSRFCSSSVHLKRRHFSAASILSGDSTTTLTSRQKTAAALSLLRSEHDPNRVLDICRAATLTPECHMDRVAFSLAIKNLSKSNNFSVISQFIEELKTRPDLRTERFGSHAIVLYGQANMLDHALKTFKELNEQGICCSVRSLNALLFAGILAKDYKEVKRIYLEFPKTYGIDPNLETYNTVIKAFCESGSSTSAYSLLTEMDRKGLKPNATTFGNMIAGFYKEEKEEEVLKVLNMMKERKVGAGLGTYNIRIQSLCKLKRSSDAKELFDMMLSSGIKPNSATFSILIHGFCKEGKLEEANKLFKNMLNRGYKPDSGCYFTLVYYLCEGGDFENALIICKESMEKGWYPQFSCMKTLVNGLASNSKVEEARELIGKLKEKFKTKADIWDEIQAGFPQ